MIILGELYKFTKDELNNLNKNINFLPYKDNTPNIILSDINSIIKDKQIKCIVLNTKNKIPNEILQYLIYLEQSSNIKYITIQDFLEKYLNKVYIDSKLKDISYLAKIKNYNIINYTLKRVIDYAVSIPLLLVTSPFMLYSVYKIKKESPDAGVIFKQLRVGQDNKEFVCYKFRSMRTDIEYHNDYTQEKDPRIFPWGDFMRKTRIDELPQLWNVFKGDMHLLGPRAEWSKLVKDYEQEIPYYNLRHTVKPGITGWAQVKYRYGANLEDTKQKLMYDLYYIKNWSLWLEIKTIFKTIMVVIGKKGM